MFFILFHHSIIHIVNKFKTFHFQTFGIFIYLLIVNKFNSAIGKFYITSDDIKKINHICMHILHSKPRIKTIALHLQFSLDLKKNRLLLIGKGHF